MVRYIPHLKFDVVLFHGQFYLLGQVHGSTNIFRRVGIHASALNDHTQPGNDNGQYHGRYKVSIGTQLSLIIALKGVAGLRSGILVQSFITREAVQAMCTLLLLVIRRRNW